MSSSNDPSTTRTPMSELEVGDKFIGPDGHTVYKVVTPAAEHDRGWVDVRNLSMTDDRAAELLAEPGAVEPGCDPRDGFFAYSYPTYVQPIDTTAQQAADDRTPTAAAEDADDDTDGM